MATGTKIRDWKGIRNGQEYLEHIRVEKIEVKVSWEILSSQVAPECAHSPHSDRNSHLAKLDLGEADALNCIRWLIARWFLVWWIWWSDKSRLDVSIVDRMRWLLLRLLGLRWELDGWILDGWFLDRWFLGLVKVVFVSLGLGWIFDRWLLDGWIHDRWLHHRWLLLSLESKRLLSVWPVYT